MHAFYFSFTPLSVLLWESALSLIAFSHPLIILMLFSVTQWVSMRLHHIKVAQMGATHLPCSCLEPCVLTFYEMKCQRLISFMHRRKNRHFLVLFGPFLQVKSHFYPMINEWSLVLYFSRAHTHFIIQKQTHKFTWFLWKKKKKHERLCRTKSYDIYFFLNEDISPFTWSVLYFCCRELCQWEADGQKN